MPRLPAIKQRRLRNLKRIVVALVALDAVASMAILMGVGSPHKPRIALTPTHPEMTSRHLERILNTPGVGPGHDASRQRRPAYACISDQSGGWDYMCRNRLDDIGYFNVSRSAITKRSVIHTNGHLVELISTHT